MSSEYLQLVGGNHMKLIVKGTLLGLFLSAVSGAPSFATDDPKQPWPCERSHHHLIGGYQYTLACLKSASEFGPTGLPKTTCDISRKVLGPYPAAKREGLVVNADHFFTVDDWNVRVDFDWAAQRATIQAGGLAVASCAPLPELDEAVALEVAP
jgi:hypothetical protein